LLKYLFNIRLYTTESIIMSRIIELIAKDDEGEGCPPLKFDGETSCFAIFLRKFLLSMENQGFHDVLRNDPRDVPVRPNEVYHRLAGLNFYNPPQPGDGVLAEAYEKKDKIWSEKCQRVLGAWKRCLSQEVKDDMRAAGANMGEATRNNILNLIEVVRDEHGVYKDGQAELNYDKMRTIPSFKDVASTKAGLKQMGELIEERDGWGNAPEIWTDNQKRQFLLKKMTDWPAIAFVHSTCERDPNLTYDLCKLELTRKLKKIQDSNLVCSRQAREMAAKASPLYSNLAEAEMVKSLSNRQDVVGYSDSTSSANSRQQQAIMRSSMDQWTTNVGSTANNYNNMSLQRSRRVTCYNCGQFDHMSYDCTAPFCSRCLNAGLPSSHTTNQCKSYKTSLPRQSQEQLQPQPQPQRSGQVSRKRSAQHLSQPLKEMTVNQPYLQSKARLVGYPPRGTGPIGQTPRGPTPQLPRRYLGNVADIMSEVEQNGDDPDDPDVLHAMMGAIQTQLAQSEEPLVDIPEDADWDPNQN